MLTAVAMVILSDVKNPKLYKKVRRFYEKEGVEFTEISKELEILMDYLAPTLIVQFDAYFKKPTVLHEAVSLSLYPVWHTEINGM